MRKLLCAVAALFWLPPYLLFAVPAYADGDAISGYVAQHGGEVCQFVRDEPDLVGVRHAIDHILDTSGLPQDQTGRLLAGSVGADCPEDAALVEEFVWYLRHHQQQAGGVGAALGS